MECRFFGTTISVDKSYLKVITNIYHKIFRDVPGSTFVIQ